MLSYTKTLGLKRILAYLIFREELFAWARVSSKIPSVEVDWQIARTELTFHSPTISDHAELVAVPKSTLEDEKFDWVMETRAEALDQATRIVD